MLWLSPSVLAVFTNVFTLTCVAVSVCATGLVEVDGEFNFSRFANIEAKQIRIFWDSAFDFMPEAAVDFLAASRHGLWRSALDGPAETEEQVLVAGLHLFMYD